LLVLARPQEALTLLDHYATNRRILAADDFQLRLDALAALGQAESLRALLQQRPLNARELMLVCAHLIHWPDATTLAAVFDNFQRAQLPKDPETYSASLALFVTAGVAGDWVRLRVAADRLKVLSGARMLALNAVETFFKRGTTDARLESILPALQGLPLEVIYALHERYRAPGRIAIPGLPATLP
jgi:hypothetical protein